MLTGPGDFAATGMFSSLPLHPDSSSAAPSLRAWKRDAYRLAVALSNEGHFGWEDFRQALLREQSDLDLDLTLHGWDACQRWLGALSNVAHSAGLIDVGALARLSAWADHGAALDAP